MKMQMSKTAKFFLYFFLIVVTFFTLLPLLYTLSASFKSNMEIMSGHTNLIPNYAKYPLTARGSDVLNPMANFAEVWGMSGSGLQGTTNFADYTVNSLKVAALSVIITVTFTAMSAYCFQRGRFPGKTFLYYFFMATMFIGAGSITVFPILRITTKVGLNNWWGLAIVLSSTGGVSNLFLTIGYLKTIPKDLDESAKIDGCTFFSTWWRVILPLSIPILGTIALMTFRGTWNTWMLPRLMLASDQTATTLVVAIVNLANSGGSGASQYNLMMAGSMLSMAPMLIMFLIMNETFVEGITQGSVKG